jgi:hypothetical protein
LRYTPIFDTCVFIDAVDDAIAWTKLCAARPRHGWPLSWVTCQQLLHGLSKADGPGFLDSREALNKACELCKGKILDPPICFVRRRILQLSLAPFPSKKIRDFLRGVCASETRLALDPLVNEIARSCETQCESHIRSMRCNLETLNPKWEETRAHGRSTLTEDQITEAKRSWDKQALKGVLAEAFLEGLDVSDRVSSAARLARRLDAALEFEIRRFEDATFSTSKFERAGGEFLDGMQLHYLAWDSFCFVTSEKRLPNVVRNSSQSNRVLNIDQYLATLND